MTKYNCPVCRVALKVPSRLPAKIRCPKCGTKFLVPVEAATVPAAVSRPASRLDLPIAEPPAAPPVSKPTLPVELTSMQPGPPLGVILGIVAGAVLFLAIGIGLLVYCFTAGSRAAQADASTPTPATDKEESAAEVQPVARPSAPTERAEEAAQRVPRVSQLRLPPEQQEKVNQAIDRGIAYLKAHMPVDDRGRLRPGAGALVGWTLVECGVPVNDPAVAQAAAFVRTHGPRHTSTYDLSLFILFLDRLNDPKDKELIQTMALRLVAGQNAAGGWTYNCHTILTPTEERQLIAVLQSLPPAQVAPTTPGSAGRIAPESPSEPQRMAPIVRHQGQDRLPPKLRDLPVFRFQPGQRVGRDGDNSNTQFAILALWAARRHGLPLDRPLALVDARFRQHQNTDGSWGYYLGTSKSRGSMTCAGLLGLAVGRGIGMKVEGASSDPAIEQGLQYLSQAIGRPAVRRRPGGGRIINADAWGDLYFLWSVERGNALRPADHRRQGLVRLGRRCPRGQPERGRQLERYLPQIGRYLLCPLVP